MKRYKYAIRKSKINTEKIAKYTLILVVTVLFFRFLSISFNHDKILENFIVNICRNISMSEMPGYAYLTGIDIEQDDSIIGKVLNDIYPISEYINASSSNVLVTGYDKYFDESIDEPDGNNSTQNSGNAALNIQETTAAANMETGTSAAQNNGSSSSSASNTQDLKNVISNNVITGTVYPKSSLESYNYLYSNFYTVTSITSLGTDKLKPKEFLEKDMTITHNADTPQILIFHTHSQENFADSVEGDASTTIVGVGEYLTTLLRDKYGYNVIHDTSVYDYVDGKLDRSKAYTYATDGIEKILQDNPSIEVVIDLHRDGVAEDTRLVTEIDGKQTAKIMFFNGISYSNVNGNISYLYNPYIDENLSMSLQMQLLGNAYYPGFLRRIYINAYRYCLHERGKSMLIEAGAQTNTVEEVKNAMEPLSDMLDKLLDGQKVY